MPGIQTIYLMLSTVIMQKLKSFISMNPSLIRLVNLYFNYIPLMCFIILWNNKLLNWIEFNSIVFWSAPGCCSSYTLISYHDRVTDLWNIKITTFWLLETSLKAGFISTPYPFVKIHLLILFLECFQVIKYFASKVNV